MLKGKRETSDNAAATKGNGCKKLVTLKMWLITLLMKASPLGSKKKKKKKTPCHLDVQTQGYQVKL